MDIQIVIFSVVVLIYSAIIHEYMHGWMAERLGDTTAKDEGRLTMNPIPHIDPIGSLLLPFILISTGASFVFGWAKPVPFNPNNLRDRIYGGAKVAAAGPFANLIMALFFGLVLRIILATQPFFVNQMMFDFIVIIVQINLLLMIFNLMPIPPLDGSKILMPFLPYHWKIRFLKMEQYGFILVLAFVMVGFQFIIPVISFLFRLIVGA
ncbi:MAG: site-2 protease family protein [Patescibacteria group bacterium]|jgi:Zn-dependent protease|nr:site-2 protease family protein [Patescibacteria group bacterium]